MELQAPLNLYLSCKDLTEQEEFDGSNPFAVVYIRDEENEKYKEVGRTETIENQLSPTWSESILVHYEFEKVQEIKVEVYNQIEHADADLSEQIYIGAVETKMGKFMGRTGNKKEYELRARDNTIAGSITIRGIEIANNLDILSFQLRLTKLKVKDCSVFYDILQLQKIDQSYVKVHTSDHVMVTKKRGAVFKFEVISSQILCNNDESTPMKFVFRVWDDEGNHKYLGEHETCVEEFIKLQKFEIANLEKKKPKKVGLVHIETAELQKRYSFLEFISSGCEISLFIGIDFTKSNGLIDDKESLHYIKTTDLSEAHQFNQYQKAIWSVGRVLEDYDTDKQIPVYGFGGKVGDDVRPSHDFALTFDVDNDEVEGIEGVMDIYEKALKSVQLSGPTFFTPILKNVFNRARSIDQRGELEYYVMLILTDGQIDDMSETVKTIVDNAHLPVSIIIAGVGDADFENMNQLDGDDERLHYMTSEGKKEAVRDIVQFVPMNEFAGKGFSVLAEKTLEEVPEQVTSYFALKGTVPSNGRAKNFQELLSVIPENKKIAQVGRAHHMNGAVNAVTKAAGGKGHLEKRLYASKAETKRLISTADNDSFRVMNRKSANSSQFKSSKWFKKT